MSELEKLIDIYMKNAVIHGEGTLEGNYKKTNKAHDKLINAYKKIKEFDNKLNSLLPLLSNENISVRSWSATHLLPHSNEAKDILKKISKEDGLLAFDAKMVLKEWENGNLKLDF